MQFIVLWLNFLLCFTVFHRKRNVGRYFRILAAFEPLGDDVGNPQQISAMPLDGNF